IKRDLSRVLHSEEILPLSRDFLTKDEWGSLFECLFEFVDCGGHHEFAELAVPSARVDSGAETTLDGRKGGHGHPVLAV
ncbi:hypothetical protein, partial [Halobacterium salinarum]|uniref:hypothetical protein n=1 Tax=Halobacterium salinarum TaxID=2242 RepID=UPI003D801DBC